MSDLNYIDRATEIKIAGQNSTGLGVNYVAADVNGNMNVVATTAGPVVPGTVAASSNLVGGQYNTTLPTLTTGQQASIQLDSSGHLLVNLDGTYAENYGVVGATTLRTASQIGNATGAADFNAGATSAQTLRTATNLYTAGTALTSTLVSAKQALDVNIAGGVDIGIADKTTYTYGTTAFQPVGGVYQETSPSLTSGQSGAFRVNANRNLQVADTIDIATQYRSQSVTTTAAEALGAGTILVNRKFISLTPVNGTIYWGTSNAVTTSSGSPIFKNQNMTFAFTDQIHIYIIAASGTVDCRVVEGS